MVSGFEIAPINAMALTFLILAFSSILSTRLKISPVLLEIIAGLIFGPYVLNLIILSDELLFLKDMGLIILLFLAGLDFDFKNFRERIPQATLIAIPPGIVGFGLAFMLLPLEWFTFIEIIIIGIVLTTTSISLSVSVLRDKLEESPDKFDTVVLAIILSNVLMVLITGIITNAIETNTFQMGSVLLQFIIVISFIFLVLYGSQKIKLIWYKNLDLSEREAEYYQSKFAFGLLGLILFISFLLGIELAVAAFFAGVYVKETTYLEREDLSKFNNIGYGFLIPIFFFVMGAQINPNYLLNWQLLNRIFIILSISFILQVILTAITTYFADFTIRESINIGIGLSACSLSGGFAILEIADKSNVITQSSYSILASVITLSVVMTLVALELFDRISREPLDMTIEPILQ